MTLIEILKQTQTELIKSVVEFLKGKDYEMIATDKYVFAKGSIPVMLVAHLDTVHTTKPIDVYYDKKQQVLWSPEGIGGDDRCGVYAILDILEKGYRPYILFTTDEEKGGLGAKAFTEQYLCSLNQDIKYMIEIDRRGDKQAVFYRCGNKEFQDYVIGFGFTKQYGSFSDISVLSPALDIASVNLSAGYYNEHTKQEHIKLAHLLHTVNLVKKMLDDIDNCEFFDYQETTVSYYSSTKNSSNKNYDDFDDYAEDDYSVYTKSAYWKMWDDWAVLTAEQWKQKYECEKPVKRQDVWQL